MTYTHGEGATKVIEDDPRTRVARVVHCGVRMCVWGEGRAMGWEVGHSRMGEAGRGCGRQRWP
jgi:hypothetical protein